MNLRSKLDDDPGFVRLVSAILDSLVLRYSPEVLASIEVDNWFDHKWLNFSGKMQGAVGVWKHSLTIPPFHPNRIRAQTVFKLNQQREYELIVAPAVHSVQPSSANLNRKFVLATHAADSGICVWWSGNTKANAKGSLMAYIQDEIGTESWYTSFERRNQWIVNKTKNIAVKTVQTLLHSAESAASRHGAPGTQQGDSIASAEPPSVR